MDQIIDNIKNNKEINNEIKNENNNENKPNTTIPNNEVNEINTINLNFYNFEKNKTIVILLNCPFDTDQILNIKNYTNIIICADGASNNLFDNPELKK